MKASALLYTSFLITLVNENRPNHEAAKQYFRHMLQTDVPMYLSAIAAGEFSVKQPITDLPLNHFRMLNFNVAHGQLAARLLNALESRDAGDGRVAVRDDVKLMAQASHEQISFILTEDASTLQKYCDRLRHSGLIQTRTITLKDAFDANAFNADGQRGFGFTDSDESDT
jgi:hypothetical protein